MNYQVKLTYFKAWGGPKDRGGKYYSQGEYYSSKQELWEIWDEVEALLNRGKRPGLVDGAADDYHVLVEVLGHPHEHPYLRVRKG